MDDPGPAPNPAQPRAMPLGIDLPMGRDAASVRRRMEAME